MSMEVLRLETRPGGAKFEDVRELVSGARGKTVYETGDIDAGIWSAGITVGLIHDIVSFPRLNTTKSDCEIKFRTLTDHFFCVGTALLQRALRQHYERCRAAHQSTQLAHCSQGQQHRRSIR